MTHAPQIIIEICPDEPRATACLMDGSEIATDPDILSDIKDCTKSGDCQEACEFIRDQIGVEFRIVARDQSGKYENRLATDAELQATCEAIYFDHSADEFSDDADRCKTHLIWEAANMDMSHD
jgi:hypothetical protein